MLNLQYTNIKEYINPVVISRVPENKQHMVLPEIEEEEDLGASKLSLTSLLLGKTHK